MRIRALTLALLFAPTVYFGQQVTPEMLLHPPANSWPTYNGDYSGRRFSSLKQIDAKNVASLKTAWVYRAKNYGKAGFGSVIKSTPLEVNGALYFTMPDNIWAVDARTGREIWHYKYPPNQGMHIGQRGVAMWGNWLYFESPDCNLISLDAKDGKVRWQKKIADVKLEYFCTMSPLVVGNHIVAGVGGDSLDNPGYLLSLDPETGAVQWRWDTEPSPGQPGANTWPDANARKHGGGMTWMTGTYDPELHLIYWGIGNPNPVHDGAGRKGDNLWTCSIVALNVETGKMAWGYQVSPHDTHDWDAVQTPILFDAVFDGHKRRLLAQASRTGYFFVLDRSNGHHLLTAPFI
ncbi:MAG: PQQ-binding-like beta-propeller repeat protein, partial [Bryobacteraceae bacterium]